MHERPGVYSSYDASTVVSAGRAAKVIGVAAKAVKGTAGEVVTLTGYAAGVAAFGEDAADTPGMSTILRLLFANGASTVAAVRVAEAGAVKDYQDAFAALGGEEARILVCDSAEETVQQALRTAVEDASAARMERIAVVGGDGESAAELVTHAAALNSERMVLVGPDALDSGGKTLPGVFAAAALAGVIASGRDPGVPLNGAEIRGLGGLGTAYTDNDIDLLVRGGVTPLESTAGTVSPVRGITTRTTTGGAADTTWRELTTILIVDDVIPAVRQALRSKFARAKNTAQSRSAIRSQVIVELEKKVAELEGELREGQEAIQENARLRELLGLRSKRQDLTFESAKVTARSASNWQSTLTLSKGEEAGLQPGNCVITSTGVLVGVVSEVGSHTATVSTVIDTSMEMGGIITRTNSAGVLEGDFALMKEGRLKLSYLPDGAQLVAGDEVLTSGKGDVYPSGLVVGQVEGVFSDASGMNRYAVVAPEVALDTLVEVFVIKDFDIVE